ncbi:hypothetical protein F0562_016444 [Nyssa sinensis]|uniref:Uncharacterized protein n=1 Tax=Nyssa sinensis TaxID=561372 RepID=A0A5J4ZMS1_9ASTE|nr:hypothetical protein F0562_016444 [Nyssa sinensis]
MRPGGDFDVLYGSAALSRESLRISGESLGASYRLKNAVACTSPEKKKLYAISGLASIQEIRNTWNWEEIFKFLEMTMTFMDPALIIEIERIFVLPGSGCNRDRNEPSLVIPTNLKS